MKLGRNATVKETLLHFAEWLSALQPTTTVALGPLRLVRVIGDLLGPDAELLDDALPSGRTSITEVSAIGVVALVRVTHGGTLPLLFVDGEQIVGAKQNRIVNASFLVAPGQSVDVPVSCVERGRWRCNGPSFGPSDTTIAARARAAKLRRLHASLERGRGHDGDQQAVWRDVDRYLSRTGTSSESAAFDDAFQHRRVQSDPTLSSFEPAPGQVGIAAVCDGSLVGLDLFGSPSLYARGWKKVARGVLAEVYDDREATGEADALGIVSAAIQAIAACEPMRRSAPGIGQTLHAAAAGVTFTGVVHDEVLYHAAAAPSAEPRSR
jgi:ARG/rhodanese/phosphatase superfamily protein